jgi:hypothetical protein
VLQQHTNLFLRYTPQFKTLSTSGYPDAALFSTALHRNVTQKEEVRIVANPNWYNLGPRNDNVLVNFAGDPTPARVEAIFGSLNKKYLLVRYYVTVRDPTPGYRNIIHRVYKLDKDLYIIKVQTVHDHAHMVPNSDRAGLFFRDMTVLRDMSR